MEDTARVPFSRDDLDRVLAFCADHPANAYPTALRRRLVAGLTTSERGVIELHGPQHGAVVAVVVDAIKSGQGCAVLELLGVRSGPTLPRLLERVITEAESFLRAGPRRGLEVPVRTRWSLWEPTLVRHGYALAFTSYEMATPRLDPGPPLSLPGPSWRWADTTEEWIAAYHNALVTTMGPVPGSYICSLAALREMLDAGAARPKLLLCGARVAGFSRVSLDDEGVGRVDLIGRHPDFQGQGLGPLLLNRAMTGLARQGARRFALNVVSSNEKALALYYRHGFELIERVPVYQRFS